MAISVFDLFKIGIGPSSSHTVGPMKAACMFVTRLADAQLLSEITRIQCTLFGSLAHTGRGHGTDKAIMLGLGGALPDSINPDSIEQSLASIRESGVISLAGQHQLLFNEKKDLVFNKRKLLPSI